MKAFKAPSPDGLHAGFFQCFWLIVRNLMVKEVQKNFRDKVVPDYLNRTHMTLIPKAQRPESLNNYKPISLCNSIYKVVTKIIEVEALPESSD